MEENEGEKQDWFKKKKLVILREKQQDILKVREKEVLWVFASTTAEEQTG